MRGAERPGIVTAVVGIVTGAVYVGMLYPSVPGGDAGELITAAARLEVAHPPGYPLWTMLAHLATLVPVGTIAWRVNLLSAVCDAGAAAVIAATVTTASRSAAAGVAAGGLFAFSPVVWTYAVGAEVFPLHNLLVALLCLLTLVWLQRGAERRLGIGIFFLLGLGLAHHHTLVFYAVPIALWMLWYGRPTIAIPARLAELALAVAAGLACYLYLPLAARHATTLSWGDPSTFHGFVDHVLRRDYGTFQLASGVDPAASDYGARLTAWLEHTAWATLGVGLGLAILGALSWLRADHATDSATRSWVALLLVCLAVYVLGFHALANLPVGDPLYRSVTARFWQQADVPVFLLVGLGFGVATSRLSGEAAARAATLLVLLPLLFAYASHDQHRDETVAQYGRALLEPLAPNTLLLTRGDLVTNVSRYLQALEDVRPDVVVLDQELLTKPWYVARAAREHPDLAFPGAVYDPRRADGFSMRTFLDANLRARPVAVYPEWKTGDPSVDGTYELWPVGLALQVAPVAAPPALDAWRRDAAAAFRTLDAYGWLPVPGYEPGTWERVARDDVWLAHHRYGWWLLTKALERNGDPALLDAARVVLEDAAKQHLQPPWFVFRNLGLVYERLALHDPRWRAAQLEAWQNYLALAPEDDDGRAAIAATVERLLAEQAAR